MPISRASTLHPDLARLQDAARYARFRKVDLHIHTPAVAWCWNQHLIGAAPKAGTLKPKDVAAALVASDIELAAITDHDSVRWVSDVMRETKDLAKKKGRDLTVLPGVEITTYDGVHLLAIFPGGKNVSEIEQMLIRFGLPADGAQSKRARDDYPCARIAEEIRHEGGLVIAPHANNPKMGIWGGSSSEHKGKRVDWLQGGVARILACGPNQVEGLAAAMTSAGISGTFAYIRHSDAHTFDDIGVNATYIKLAELSVEGLRQVIYEPALRVSMDPPSTAAHPAILGVELRGGYFHDELASFSDHLNVLIGPNYAGKSAILDAIRFVFDDPCFGDSADRQSLFSRVEGILAQGEIRLWFRDATGVTYRAERSTVMEESRIAGQHVLHPAAPPTVSRIDGDVDVTVDIAPLDLLRVDFYGQGSVGKVAKFADRHRDLIDAMGSYESAARALDPTLDSPARSILLRLRESSRALQKSLEQRTALEAELATIPAIIDQRNKLQAQAKSTLLNSWGDWQLFHRSADALREELDDIAGRIDPESLAEQLLDDLTSLPTPRKDLDATATTAHRARDDFEKNVRAAAKTYSKTVSADVGQLSKALDKWATAYDKQQTSVTTKLKELRLASDAALSARISELNGKIERIEKRRSQLERYETEWQSLQQRRTQLLAELDAQWTALREKRRAFVESLNAATGDPLQIAFEPAIDTTRFRSHLDKIIGTHGSRSAMVQKRDTQLDHLIQHYTPAGLSADLFAGDPSAIVERSSVTVNTATFLTELPLAVRLDVALYAPDDRVEITWRREGDDTHSPLGDLSPGERALALLTVAFANRIAPIVIDQPEDELGQMLVTADLIETIRAKKTERQFIVVTHNANVPVLGDAEGIFHMQNLREGDPPERRCSVKDAGSIECEPIKAALLGLEGGRESFERRHLRYNIEGASG